MRSVIACVALAVFLAALTVQAVNPFRSNELGDGFVLNALAKYPLPRTTDEIQSGSWRNLSTYCVPGRGYPYAMSDKGSSSKFPVTLYFSANGQVSALSVRTNNPVAQPLQGYWESPRFGICEKDGCMDLFMLFRDPSSVCDSSKVYREAGGDRLVVGGSRTVKIPIVGTDAQNSGWYLGNCIPGMGTHWALNAVKAGGSTFNASTLFPIMPMYDSDTGHINAILVNSPHVNKIWPFGGWEGPFPNFLMCKNWCSGSGCGFKDADVWTTMHLWFNDPKQNSITCDAAKCRLI